MSQPPGSSLGESSLLATILATAPIGVGLLDRELRFVRANDALAWGTGHPRADHLGRRVDEIWPHLPTDVLARLGLLLETGEAIADVELSSEVDGEPHHLLGSYYPLRGPEGEVSAVGVIVVDVTARMAAAEALKASGRRLRAL